MLMPDRDIVDESSSNGSSTSRGCYWLIETALATEGATTVSSTQGAAEAPRQEMTQYVSRPSPWWSRSRGGVFKA
jgi:hypothetical protein